MRGVVSFVLVVGGCTAAPPRTEAPAPTPAASASTAKATFFRAYTLPSCEPGNGLCHGGREHVEVELEGAGEAAEAIGSRLAWALSYTHDGPTAISGKLVTPAAGGVPTVAPDKPLGAALLERLGALPTLPAGTAPIGFRARVVL